METKMTLEERQAFLAETRVGIIRFPEEGRGPLTVPVWYSYKPGMEVCVWMKSDSRKARLLHKTQRISFYVQDPTPPMYMYVSIEGPFTIQPVDLEKDIHPMTLRYYGKEHGEQYFADITKDEIGKDTIMVCIRPEHWLTKDYSKQGSVQN
jgi:nitroimidazol reductase NimA-like FMN-containing flavoprotein (pyridoxamine 5'-phosphate oxidase superfamily)